jgi:hypothetical protein
LQLYDILLRIYDRILLLVYNVPYADVFHIQQHMHSIPLQPKLQVFLRIHFQLTLSLMQQQHFFGGSLSLGEELAVEAITDTEKLTQAINNILRCMFMGR